MRLIVFCDNQTPRGFLVEPMYDSGPLLPALAGKVVTMMKQSVHDRPRPISNCRMHHHACRLVDHQNVGVLVQNFERNLLRLCFDGLSSGLRDIYAFTPPEPDPGLGGQLAIDEHASRTDPFLQLRAGMVR